MDKIDSLEKQKEGAGKVCPILKVLSNETRLLTICYLGEGEKSVNEIEQYLGISQSTASQHLSKLKLNGIVSDRREANLIYYSVLDKRILDLLSTLKSSFCPE